MIPFLHATRDRSRFASLLLLLPMVVVAAASIVGLAVSGSAETALQQGESVDIQLANIRDHIHEAALNGTSYLVTHDPVDRAALAQAAHRVDSDLAALVSSGVVVGPGEPAALASTARVWQASAAAVAAVVASSSNPAALATERAPLEDELNAALAAAATQLQVLDTLKTADTTAQQRQSQATQTAVAIAIAAAIAIGFVGALLLLKQLKERQEDVRRRERRLSALVENASDGILVVTRDGKVAFVTPSFSEEFFDDSSGLPNFDAMIHPDDRALASRAWQRVLAGKAGTESEVEARLLRRDGEWRHVWAKLTNRLDDPAVNGVVLNVTDVSDRHEFEKQLTHQALHDALTGLPNRDLLRHRMERAAKAGGEEHSVLYLDCDDFKRINDTYGHQAGDQFLAEVGRRLVDCLRPEDTVARLGGDEFAVLLEATGVAGATLAATRILGAVGAPFALDGKPVHPSVSIGVAAGQHGSLHPETLLADADLAMYFAKRAGKGGYSVFVDAMRTDMLERLSLGEDLRAAVESASLEVAYQPIIDLQSGGVVGAEALARWHHPSRGWVGPDTFIALAEELGFVERIDSWVLREACAQGKAWIDGGVPEFRMAVNLSGRDLAQPDLVEQVARTLRETGFPPEHLELELTEGVAINEASVTQETLVALKALGLHLAIDDFGTGYSALSRLRSLPFDRLKIDKAFVDDIGLNTRTPMLVDTILDMAHVLGLAVVAEGVETTRQAEYLRERACDFAQGYLFNKPMGQAEFGALLTQPRPEVLVSA